MREIECADVCRLAWVAGFCIGPFGGNERPWKPFNPILGETFELDLQANGVRFLAEQVRLLSPLMTLLVKPLGSLRACITV